MGSSAHTFLICLFRIDEGAFQLGVNFINQLQATVRKKGGVIQLRSDKPKFWSIVDGKDHNIEPNHLNPAVFEFNSIMLAGFPNSEDVQTWWNSDDVFKLLMWRECMEKIG